MMVFLLKSAGIIALFLVIYKLFLEHDTYFKSIRIYFITGILVSFIIPLISITKYIEAPQTQQFVYSQNFQNLIYTSTETPFNWAGFLFTIYIIGIALSGLYLMYQIITLIKLLNSKSVKEFKSYKIIETQKDVSPFSFFKYIVYNPTQFSQEEIQQLLKHEEAHVLQKHSIDMLLAQLLVCVQWFNPFAWWYKKVINQNLEYIADKEAKFTITPKNYSYLLLKTTAPNYQVVLANNFYNSLLKKRIMMLNKNHSPRFKQFKLVLILPLLVGFVFAFNTEVVAQQKGKTKVTVDLTNFSIQLDKDGSTEDLKFITKKFKSFGYNVKFSKIKRNSKKEVTGVKISAKKGTKNTQYAVNGTTAIKPFKVSYFSKTDNVEISTGTSIHHRKRGYFYSVTTSVDSDTPINDDNIEMIFFDSDKDSLHTLKSKGKNSFIFISGKDKSKGHASLFSKQKGNVNAVWIDDDGNKTEIIEVLTDGKKHKIIKNNSKSTWKDKDGNITKVIEVKTDKNGNISKTIRIDTDKKGNKFIIKDIDDDNHKVIDIDASNNKNKFVFSSSGGGTPLFVIDGKVVKEDFMKKINPESIKSISVLKGEKAIKKYGKKGKNGVIEITLKKKK